jgi:hypothetical protein
MQPTTFIMAPSRGVQMRQYRPFESSWVVFRPQRLFFQGTSLVQRIKPFSPLIYSPDYLTR